MIILTLVFFIVDLISKVIITKLFDVYESVSVINNFFNITYVKNTGAAWSILSNEILFLIMISLSIIMSVVVYIKYHKPTKKIDEVAYSMILGGAIGNFSNRLFLGYVIDFLDFNFFGYNYPVFNFADMFIVIGAILLIISSWRKKDEI